MKEFLKKVVISILTFEAALLLKRHNPKIIAITGSVGKTTTKDAIYAAVKGSVTARKSEKSFNSDIGVPLTILGLGNAWSNPFLWFKNIIDGALAVLFSSEYPAVLILETGIDRPGDMEKLTSWIKPDVVVLTRLPDVPVHVEYFKTPEAVVAEKMKLVFALKPDGVLVYNNDDQIIQNQLSAVRQKQVGFGRYAPTSYTASDDTLLYSDNKLVGSSCTITHEGTPYAVQIRGSVGTQLCYAAAAAFAVADLLNISGTVAERGLADMTFPNGRMRVIDGIKGTTLIDDTYNSSPAAAEAAIGVLREVQFAKRRIAVLGDMLELGSFSAERHRALGALAAQTVDILLTVGVRSRGIAEGALQAGMSERTIYQYDDVDRAGRELQLLLESGDVVLIKASQGIRAERIVEEVMANPERAEFELVRQESSWKRIEQPLERLVASSYDTQ